MVRIIVGVVFIVEAMWLYRCGLKVRSLIALALGITSLMLGYWSEQTIITESRSSLPTGTVGGAATPKVDEGGV